MSDMSDPTLRILASLDNPERYVRESGVPVFVPHVRRDSDGEVEASVSPDDLAGIAEAVNAKIEEYGALVRVTRGHVKLAPPGEPPPPEDEQPPIWGWAKNARVGEWGPARKLGLLVDIYFQKDRHADAMEYPFRSAEYYPETGEITGIALLRRDPELDLGVLTYARQGTPERATEVADMPTEDDLDELLAGDDDQEQYADETDGDTEQGEPDGDEFSPEESEQYARMCRYMHQRASDELAGMGEDDEDRPHVEQMARAYGRMAYGAGEPGGGNSFVPGTGADDLDEPPMDPIGDEDGMEDMEQYGSDHLRGDNKKGQMKAIGAKGDAARKESKKRPGQGKYYGRREQPALYARQIEQLEAGMAELRNNQQMLKYERQLLRLEQAGVEFDLQQELEDARAMTNEQRARHLKKMARHYARSVTHGNLIPTDIDDVETPRQRPLSAGQRNAALAYRDKHNCSWEQAMAWAQQNV